MRLLRLVYLLVGIGLLALVVSRTDLAEVGGRLAEVGAAGIAVVLVVYGLAFVADTASWQLTFPSLPFNGRWLCRLWRVRMIGEAFNTVLPAGSFGGEPAKAMLLKKRYHIVYAESAASLVLIRTTNLLAMIVFAAVGFVLMRNSEALIARFGSLAGVGLAALAVGVVGFFAVQRWRLASRLGRWLAGARLRGRLERFLAHIQDADNRFAGFYRQRPGHFAGALALSLSNWLLGTVELYCVMYFLGHPLSLTEAWSVEAVLQLVRTATFFIPAQLGALEASTVLMIGVLTGAPSLGLAAALVRRARDLVFIASGMGLGWLISFSPAVAISDSGEK
ncbi:MAG: lysylphosphatidylglycerol synthase transmembrane domain-containing protein [Alphaproteobacteria bacterium]